MPSLKPQSHGMSRSSRALAFSTEFSRSIQWNDR